MSRRHRAEKRQVTPDGRYNSPLVAHLVNVIMKSGKKSIAQRIVYGAFESLQRLWIHPPKSRNCVYLPRNRSCER